MLGIGTDGGGSIRVPSHYNGTAGLRPSARLVPETGCWPSSRETGMLDMACVGPMARTVDDLAMTLAVIAGGDGIDPFVGPAQLGDHRSVAIAGLRVGFYADDGAWPATAGTRAAVERAAAILGEAGANVEEVAPPAVAEAEELFFKMMAADGGARARADLAGANGRHVPQMTWLLENLARHALSAGEYFEVLERWSAFRSRMQLLHREARRRDLARRARARPAPRLPPGRRSAGRDVRPVGERHGALGRRRPGGGRPSRERAGPAAGRAHRGRGRSAITSRSRQRRRSSGRRAATPPSPGPCYRISDPPLMSNVEPVT